MKGPPGFRTLPPAERRRLDEASEVLTVERGTRLFEAGTPSTDVWAVLEGVVHIVRQGHRGDRQAARGVTICRTREAACGIRVRKEARS